MVSDSPQAAAQSASQEYDKARGSRFKFKEKARAKRSRHHDENGSSQHRKRRRRSDISEETNATSSRSKDTSRRKKYHEDLKDDPSTYDDTYEPNSASGKYMEPDLAFQESLFDAMADDEGAAFWEGVYGQPIHVYPNARPTEDGKLEQMNDDEYAEYVRGRMWEKTHQHVLEEREKREEARKRRKAEDEKYWQENDERETHEAKSRKEQRAFQRKVEESLRRGEERREQKQWQQAWQDYVRAWEKFTDTLAVKSKEEGSLAGKAVRGVIPWPVISGRWKDVEKDDIEQFFRKATPAEPGLLVTLKTERVRWHPDKMQQRFRANKLDEETVRTVTAVFQVVDRLWTETKDRQ